MSERKTVLGHKRICYACGTTESYSKTTGYPQWYHNRDIEDNVLCERCDNILTRNPITIERWKGRKKSWNDWRIEFKGKPRYVKIKPRTGICKRCARSIHNGEITRTNMHHLKYDESNPLDFTIELCVTCHTLEHKRLRKH